MTGTADSTPSTLRNSSAYFVERFAVEDVNSIPPERVKMISARRFEERRCKSFDIPRERPVNSITSATPSATPATLISARKGRCRMLLTTRLSITQVMSDE
jgi:hypothetical protein